MCLSPKVPKTPPPAQYQQVQLPKDMVQNQKGGASLRRRRGLYSSIFTSPAGAAGTPSVTGTTGGMTGG